MASGVATIVASCAAKMVASACELSSFSQPPFISAESTPMHPSLVISGTIIAPLVDSVPGDRAHLGRSICSGCGVIRVAVDAPHSRDDLLLVAVSQSQE